MTYCVILGNKWYNNYKNLGGTIMNIQDKTNKINFSGSISEDTTTNMSQKFSANDSLKNEFADINYNFKNEQVLRRAIKNMKFTPTYHL